MSELDKALRIFEATEANLIKLERLWKEIQKLTPDSIVFASDPKYEDSIRAYKHILDSLPKLDGWKPHSIPEDLDAIAQSRLDAQDVGEAEMFFAVERSIQEPARELREYRFRFNRKRRELIRNAINNLIEKFSQALTSLNTQNKKRRSSTKLDKKPEWQELCKIIEKIDTLIGSSVPRPPRWEDLNRHLRFAMVQDLNDIITFDWPEVSTGIIQKLFSDDDPVPVDVDDLTEIVNTNPSGNIATGFVWDRLSAEDFERLIFSLISNEAGYDNPEWLMATSARDRGRDLSVIRVVKDPLVGTSHERIIIQCKHWLSRSVSPSDITALRDQVRLWEPPRIDELIIVSSGRFTADAVNLVERINQSDTSLKIQMWPESHRERLLAARPGLIAEFRLR